MKAVANFLYYIWWTFCWFAITLSLFILIDLLFVKNLLIDGNYLIWPAIIGVIASIGHFVKNRKLKREPPGERRGESWHD